MPHPRGALIVLLSLLVIAAITLLPAAGTGGSGSSFRVERSRLGRQTARPPELPSDAIPPEHMRHYQDVAVRWMAEYLRIDTTNPPGNELKAAEWFKRVFDTEGIENRVMQYAPGRADIWARVPANRMVNGKLVSGPRERPIVLLNHMDVVSADPEHWRVPPFSATILDGAMYGRGAQDMKSEGLAQLLVLLMLKREQPLRDRDVIFLATADEEVHDSGSDWFIAHHPELLDNAEFLITEGGENLLEGNRYEHIGVDVAEKVPFWLHVVAHGQPGHASRPIDDSAPNRLVRALNRILNYQPELKVSPEVEELLAQMAPYQPPERAVRFQNIRQALKDKTFRAAVADDESLSNLLRDTISLTMFQGSKQTNVIPEESWANLDVRLLPGEDPKEFLETIRNLVNDPHISVEPLDGFARGNSSPIDTPLFASIRHVTAHYFPGTPVLPRLASGYNESQRYRPLGIVCYGFSPFMTTIDEGNTEHGNDERIRLDELRRGFRLLYDVVLSVPKSGQE